MADFLSHFIYFSRHPESISLKIIWEAVNLNTSDETLKKITYWVSTYWVHDRNSSKMLDKSPFFINSDKLHPYVY
jgi:hypothetical protein